MYSRMYNYNNTHTWTVFITFAYTKDIMIKNAENASRQTDLVVIVFAYFSQQEKTFHIFFSIPCVDVENIVLIFGSHCLFFFNTYSCHHL